MTPSLDDLRRRAKTLAKAHRADELRARQRLASNPPRSDGGPLKHADFLHVIAREEGFASWPALKLAVETHGMDRAGRVQRLRLALYLGQTHVVAQLLEQTPDLAQGDFALAVAMYDLWQVREALQRDPGAALRQNGLSRPIVTLAFSQHFKSDPELEQPMLEVAELLLQHGADVNDSRPVAPDNPHPLSVLYGAIGHAGNMALGRWLLEKGANPNDGESLYHSVELGHHEGLDMLLAHGADPTGTNALPRALDFHDHRAVEKLLAAGAQADAFDGTHVGGETPWTLPALHQAARRMSDARMVDLLLEAGADPARIYEGASAYGYACVFGNAVLRKAIEARGMAQTLTEIETLLASAVEGPLPQGQYIDPHKLPVAYRGIIQNLLNLPGKLPHMKRLVALGVEYDRPDGEGLTPVQVAGWQGLPEVMDYLLSLKPDLAHVNGYGGTLLSTIIHGSENCPERENRDYIACLDLVLKEGLALPRRAVELAGDEAVAAHLAAWAERYPSQVVEGGPA